jgi:hypothetical protein
MHYELATRLLTGCIRMRRFVLLHDWIAERKEPNLALGCVLAGERTDFLSSSWPLAAAEKKMHHAEEDPTPPFRPRSSTPRRLVRATLRGH